MPPQQDDTAVARQVAMDRHQADLNGVADMTDLSKAIDEVVAATPPSSSSNDPDGVIVYTEDELQVMRETYNKLTKEHELSPESINLQFLAYTCIVSKNRVADATKNYLKFLKGSKPLGIDHVESFEELWADTNVTKCLGAYAPAGRDFEGRSVMWIKGDEGAIEPKLEPSYVRAGILYTLAIHSDPKSLREGITFVIDTSKRSVKKKKMGNESKLQKQNQSYPLRPQSIQIAGASTTMRIVINGLIKIASVFTKQKVLDRIKFVSLEDAKASIPKESVPKYLGGNGCGVDNVVDWVKMRLERLPTPAL
uniref:CRAL-TRIO domain-containing protein n=1 Tax=Grammatophora oceanica TaxID=210454 RepID=A0A7S1VTI6_9STRA|mmetsp:Transcript_5690/g.8016  ORF Transcript_5690/g.8016 Transcript_5690/m.8016 type:complete len:309 (+) Transcript_5690:145-1071(+)|eukprot:CAMPEP_0194049656 /NCGR_PEP_ID=MMETSP0009_2-20130614/30815_1 /TAXON_ID=210454 /ORGANISM="Grammatophora oceanica, Strain CCMP 410" /LENGTH=308 /DNA_ID=CAMNT_0038695863 /DNA_START=142 /DNA_END=1068 /DNA_ORIENTATION=-